MTHYIVYKLHQETGMRQIIGSGETDNIEHELSLRCSMAIDMECILYLSVDGRLFVCKPDGRFVEGRVSWPSFR